MSLGFPIWLRRLLRESGYDSVYVEAIEIGGRGVKHPKLGWIRIETLAQIAEEKRCQNESS